MLIIYLALCFSYDQNYTNSFKQNQNQTLLGAFTGWVDSSDSDPSLM